MARWELLDTATVPGGKDELRLYRREHAFSIRVAGQGELMNSHTHGSEDALGNLTGTRAAAHPGSHLLVGGLGMGFTLAAALAVLDGQACVEVAELVPEVVRWNEQWLGPCAGFPLRDPRVAVYTGDVGARIRAADERYDAIVLDVDNGPEGLTRPANDRLYSIDGLAQAYRALRAGGLLAVWSAGPDRPFTGRLHKVGFEVEEQRVRAHGERGARHLIWLARRPA